MAPVSSPPLPPLPDFGALSDLDRFEELDSVLHRAEGYKVLDALPDAAPDPRKLFVDSERIRAIRNRLWLLGYLDKDNGAGRITPNLEKAVRLFQRDAQIKEDGWVGVKSWQVMQELVSFEDASNLEHWMLPTPKPVVHRAVNLRLHALGFLKQRQVGMIATLEALKDFVELAKRLSLTNETLGGFNLITVDALFDTDHVLECLARPTPGFFEDPRNQGFIRAVAKIELWLLGYKVIPDGSPKLEKAPRKARRARQAPISLQQALHSFWSELEPELDESALTVRSNTIDASLFRQLFIAEEDRELGDPEDDAAAAEMVAKDPNLARDTWGAIKNLGARLWDGVKRAVRWVARLVRRTVKRIVNIAQSMARTLYHAALKAFEPIKVIFSGLKTSYNMVVDPVMPGSDGRNLVIQRDRDFDMVTVIDPAADPVAVKRGLAEFTRVSSVFKATSSLIGRLVDLLVKLVKRFATGFGWLALVLSLSRIRPALREMGGLIDDIRQLETPLPA